MECILKLFGRVRHCFSHSTVASSKTRQITIRELGLNTTNHDTDKFVTIGYTKQQSKLKLQNVQNRNFSDLQNEPDVASTNEFTLAWVIPVVYHACYPLRKLQAGRLDIDWILVVFC